MKTNIKRIKIQNFKGLTAFEGEVLGKDVYLIGKNAAGKTSFIDAVWLALTGKNIPPKPVTTGAKKGLIEVELEDGYVVRVKMNSTGKTPVNFEIENLNAESEKDQFVKAPRTWLNHRIGVIDFDVNSFFAMSDAKQVEYFCKITGLDVVEIDTNIEELTESRRFDKKKLAEAQTKTGFYQKDDLEKEPVDVVKLSKDIAELKEIERVKAEQFQKVTDGVSEREASIKEKKAKAEALLSEVAILENEVKDGYSWLDIAENKPVPNSDLQTMEANLENSENINKKITEAKAYAEADKVVEKLEKAIEDANEEIQAEKDKKAAIIANKISIEGLTYDIEKECFLFNGLPFDKNQINTASQIIAGLKIGASLLNEVKVLKIDASLIDKENFGIIQSWSKEEGIELFVELVDREAGALKIEIEEN
ncbi:AAA family ATPase [Flavobacterium phage vB_FspM_pippi8-1]|uniref:AAA family ATPase n=1 Tax=Flavobacterium phage vB_FspM_pippi8-1 TaxID=2686244 RepID=A0A6B9L9E7_9CAUD|nr:AAA family ATPase [Flavobacterium phage vB_FspM_pippi8-1]QHB38566.1 AAA family ATPase [Flavobacterium phage vB_FspM_pippi8-1]